MTALSKSFLKQIRADSPAKLLNRLRELKNTVEYTRAKLRRQKNELWACAMLYINQVMTTQRKEKAEVCSELEQQIGGSKAFWANCYRYGCMIRDMKLDMETVAPSSLAQLPVPQHIKPQHLKPLAKALNAGAGPSQINRMLSRYGYGKFSSKIPGWKKAEIRKSKTAFTDWKAEMELWAEQIATTTDGHVKVRLQLHVNDSSRPTLVGTFQK